RNSTSSSGSPGPGTCPAHAAKPRRPASGSRSSEWSGRGQCWTRTADRRGHRCWPWRVLADLDRGVGGEFVWRHDQVLPRRPLPDPPRGVVNRTVARAEPAAEGAAVVARLLSERDAAEMRAHADHYQPFRLLDPVGILLRVAQRGHVDVL